MIKNLIKRGLIASRALQIAGKLRDRQVVILMYHSVMDPAAGQNTLGRIMHRPEVFRGHMEIIARYYDPVSMNDVLRFVRGEGNLPSRAVAVTFDDGYVDNYQIAAPILDSVGVPATFYVAVNSIETGAPPWPARLRYAFFSTRVDHWTDHRGINRSLTTGDEREQAVLHASDYCATLSGGVQHDFLTSLESELKSGEQKHGLMMNWDHIRRLASRGHLIGSHTMTHPNLAQIPEEEARFELSESKRRLEAALGFPIVHFSYPCPALTPHWKESTSEICRRLGYETAVTTDGGAVQRHDDPFRLRRSGPTKRIDGLRWSVDCSFVGRTPKVWEPLGYAASI
jgi:peptidoglycan/xylan/chitin deacetylase (PgdA/CDA1 family)